MLKTPVKRITGDGDDGEGKNWMPSDAEWASLEDVNAPHELHGLVRAHRNKMDTGKIIEVLSLDPGVLIDQMTVGYTQEADAEFRGVPVYDSGIKAGTV